MVLSPGPEKGSATAREQQEQDSHNREQPGADLRPACFILSNAGFLLCPALILIFCLKLLGGTAVHEES